MMFQLTEERRALIVKALGVIGITPKTIELEVIDDDQVEIVVDNFGIINVTKSFNAMFGIHTSFMVGYYEHYDGNWDEPPADEPVYLDDDDQIYRHYAQAVHALAMIFAGRAVDLAMEYPE